MNKNKNPQQCCSCDMYNGNALISAVVNNHGYSVALGITMDEYINMRLTELEALKMQNMLMKSMLPLKKRRKLFKMLGRSKEDITAKIIKNNKKMLGETE